MASEGIEGDIDIIHLSLRKRLFYALPAGVAAMIYSGPLVILQGIYAKDYGISLTTVATIILIARLFDTFTDPIIGYWSDRYHAHAGTRKPFVAAGGLLFVIGAFFLFNPPEKINEIYFLFFILLFYLGYTLFNIPHYAWGNEISASSSDSTKVYTARALMMAIGLLLFYALPQIPFFITSEFTPEVLQWAVVVAAILFIPAFFLCLTYVPVSFKETKCSNETRGLKAMELTPNKTRNIFLLWNSVKHNKPFLIFLGAFILWGIGIGSWAGLLFIFITSYLGMGEHFSLIAFIGVGGSIASIHLWTHIGLRRGKIQAWIISSVLTIVSMLCMALLDSDDASFTMLVIVMMLAYLGSVSFTIFAPALLSDIVDYGAWKDGDSFPGSYFSIYFLVMKANDAIGVAFGLAIVGWFGFDPTENIHSRDAIFGLKLAAIWLPALLFALSIGIISHIPINAHRHAIICKALARRKQRAVT